MWEDLQGALGCEGCELALPRVGPSHPDPTAMKCSELSRGFFPLPLGVKGLELSTRPSSQQPPDARTLNSSSLPPAPAAAGGVGLGSPSAEPEARGSGQSSPQPNSPGKTCSDCSVPDATLGPGGRDDSAPDPCPWQGSLHGGGGTQKTMGRDWFWLRKQGRLPDRMIPEDRQELTLQPVLLGGIQTRWRPLPLSFRRAET